jgi:hypothetical protein
MCTIKMNTSLIKNAKKIVLLPVLIFLLNTSSFSQFRFQIGESHCGDRWYMPNVHGEFQYWETVSGDLLQRRRSLSGSLIRFNHNDTGFCHDTDWCFFIHPSSADRDLLTSHLRIVMSTAVLSRALFSALIELKT